jgi:chaperonin GroEL
MNKELSAEEMILGDNVIAKLVSGTNKIANAVKVTMGPRGKNVIIIGEEGKPKVTKDGVSVAKQVQLEDPYENIAANLIKEVAIKTVSTVGDGTTTSIVIAQALINSNADVKNLTRFKAGIKDAEEKIISSLRTSLIKVVSKDTLYSIAHTSSNSDSVVADVVSTMALEVGSHGIIRVIKSDLPDTTSYVEEGCSIDRGLLSTGYINSSDTGSFECDKAYVLIINGKADVWKHYHPAAVMAHREKKPLIIIAKEFSDDVMRNTLKNCKTGGAVVIPLTAPGFNDIMVETLEDIAVYCGTTVLDPIEMEDSDNIIVGNVDSVSITMSNAVIYNSTQVDKVLARVDHITKLMGMAKNAFDKGMLANRIINLAAKTGTISVGGSIEVEMSELFDRYEDAVGAVMAAYRSGVLPGSGMALYNLATDSPSVPEGDADFALGFNTLYEAIKAPATQIYLNADLDIERQKTEVDFASGLGIDIASLAEVNLVESGIIDPIEVTIAAVSSAVTVATLMLSTGCIIK